MNIFILHENPQIAATHSCDKHVVKMILESAQMLCAAYPNGKAPYKRAFYNHPCTIWSRSSQANYQWLLDHAYALHAEYVERFDKIHRCLPVIDWCDANKAELQLPDIGLTEFAQAMPDQYKDKSAVQAYRNYYLGEKSKFAAWRTGKTPHWYSLA